VIKLEEKTIKTGIVELEINEITGIGEAIQMNSDVEPIKNIK